MSSDEMPPPPGPDEALGPADAPEPEPAEEPAGEPFDCPDLPTWVEEIYARTYIRRISQSQRWCASWWRHNEAVVRLQALWLTWEAARVSTDPAALGNWLRLYLDALNPVLLAADGPFSSCTPDQHSQQRPMPLTPVPPDWADFGPDGPYDD